MVSGGGGGGGSALVTAQGGGAAAQGAWCVRVHDHGVSSWPCVSVEIVDRRFETSETKSKRCRCRERVLHRGRCCSGQPLKTVSPQNLRCARRETRPPHSPSHENPITQAGKGRTNDKRIPQPVAVLPATNRPRGSPSCFMHTRFSLWTPYSFLCTR